MLPFPMCSTPVLDYSLSHTCFIYQQEKLFDNLIALHFECVAMFATPPDRDVFFSSALRYVIVLSNKFTHRCSGDVDRTVFCFWESSKLTHPSFHAP